MRGDRDGCLPSHIKARDPRPVEREKAKPSGDAAKDGYTRYSRRAPWGAPGDFASETEIQRYDDMMERWGPPPEINDY